MTDLPSDLQKERDKWRNWPRIRPDQIVIPGPGQESVWDYPRPPRVEPVFVPLRVEILGRQILAETCRGYRVLETSGPPVYYFPPEAIHQEYLLPSSTRCLCEWKGISHSWSIRINDDFSPDAAWSYPDPWEGYEHIKNYFAFNASRVEACFVNGERVRPQPGEYYGGWITSNIVGPFKGESGSENW